MPAMATELRALGWSSVSVDQLPGASHYLVEERPSELTTLIARYASPTRHP
jgi:hypothetical protein